MKLPKHILVTCYLLLATCCKAQLLYLQENFKGGISVDGKSYYGEDYLNSDTIKFVNTVPIGSTIKKALLISQRIFFNVTNLNPHDNSTQISLNGNNIHIDSNDIVASFRCNDSSPTEYTWLAVKDVTSHAISNNNILITPCQSCSLLANPNWNYVYDGFLLVMLYEDNTMPATNVSLYLDNQNLNDNMVFNLSGLNPINNTNDVGLSFWTNDLNIQYPINFILNSTIGNFNLGSLWFNEGYSSDETLVPGSFYYQNNTLFGLQDDSPNAFIDSSDALVNIKAYINNNINSFSLSAAIGTDPSCYDLINEFILAYSSPCPTSLKDTTLMYTLCNGSSKQLSVGTNTVNSTYSWYATDGSLSTANTASVAVTPTVSTNYIAYVDSGGCKHTEHFKIAVYPSPTYSNLSVSNVICGNNANTGTVVINGANGGKPPYSYNIGGALQTGNSFGNLTVGNYTATLTDASDCSYAQSFIITETNPVVASFSLSPNPACVNEPVAFTNTSTKANLQWWSFGSKDTSNTQNPAYVYNDTGTYQITLIAWYNLRPCSDTITNTIHIKDCPPDSIHITVPNIFTPNADGVNDSWQLAVSSYQYTVSNYQCNIYDRWGIQVFSSASLNEAWTGRSTSGESASAGSYFYLVKLTQTNSKGVSENKEFKGYLELVR